MLKSKSEEKSESDGYWQVSLDTNQIPIYKDLKVEEFTIFNIESGSGHNTYYRKWSQYSVQKVKMVRRQIFISTFMHTDL